MAGGWRRGASVVMVAGSVLLAACSGGGGLDPAAPLPALPLPGVPAPSPAPTPEPTVTPAPAPTAPAPVPTMPAPGAPVMGRPFSATGPWNLAIPADPVIDPNSAAMVANLASGAHPGVANLYNFGTKVYEADASTPRYRIDCQPPGNWGACNLEAQPVPIPDGATANSGSDAAMTVLDREAGLGYCFWQYRNDRATTSWGNVYSLSDEGDGTPPVCTGSGLPSLGGLVRMSEIEAGQIDHALNFSTQFCQSGTFRYPAGKTDGKQGGSGAVPEGARVQLDPSIDVAAIPGITPGELAVARALQVYGAYATDCGGSTMAYTFEHPRDGADPYPGVGFTFDYFHMDRIPWDRLRVLRSWNGA